MNIYEQKHMNNLERYHHFYQDDIERHMQGWCKDIATCMWEIHAFFDSKKHTEWTCKDLWILAMIQWLIVENFNKEVEVTQLMRRSQAFNQKKKVYIVWFHAAWPISNEEDRAVMKEWRV